MRVFKIYIGSWKRNCISWKYLKKSLSRILSYFCFHSAVFLCLAVFRTFFRSIQRYFISCKNLNGICFILSIKNDVQPFESKTISFPVFFLNSQNSRYWILLNLQYSLRYNLDYVIFRFKNSRFFCLSVSFK